MQTSEGISPPVLGLGSHKKKLLLVGTYNPPRECDENNEKQDRLLEWVNMIMEKYTGHAKLWLGDMNVHLGHIQRALNMRERGEC